MFHSLHNNITFSGFGGDAISKIDIALLDIAGKATEKIISKMLGGPVRNNEAVYATGLYRKDDFPQKFN